jgi:hypothetical protein
VGDDFNRWNRGGNLPSSDLPARIGASRVRQCRWSRALFPPRSIACGSAGSARAGRAITLVAPVAIAVYWSISRLAHELYTALSRVVKWTLLLWLLFDMLCLYLVRLNATPPAGLPDGRSIFKQPQLNVKIQYMAGLPADNYIPFVVTPRSDMDARASLATSVSRGRRAALGLQSDRLGHVRRRVVDQSTLTVASKDWLDLVVDRRFEALPWPDQFDFAAAHQSLGRNAS